MVLMELVIKNIRKIYKKISDIIAYFNKKWALICQIPIHQ
ncbi:hypothetical protein AO385_1459 [Moraxella catarrhalis]|uniref:Uncharacterized protein n=1 Tax=Moraxella catarrhalis TaxID=480 RepID=A0A198UJD1_MORCA|nr:hypothetical protein AO384_0936 [Moraxella catarrhalis]OAU99027.1 hypothetical protein AO385_1459 [Moraxella catarrhalis]OAU99042.1 hypothetical protein AO383_0311 [Moraxella catarrhalis]